MNNQFNSTDCWKMTIQKRRTLTFTQIFSYDFHRMMLLIAVALVSLATVWSSPIEMSYVERTVLLDSDLSTQQTKLDYRLKKDVLPRKYDILLKPYFMDEANGLAFTFDGFVKILIGTNAPGVKSFQLHAHRLNIKSTNVYANNAPMTNIILGSNNYDNETQLLTISLSQELVTGRDYFVEVEYTGSMDEDMQGFYRSYYMENGIKKWLGSTQLEQTHARRLLPCFDEPSFKANFHLKIDRPEKFKPTLSNTKILVTRSS
jgi:aminopeptidase N